MLDTNSTCVEIWMNRNSRSKHSLILFCTILWPRSTNWAIGHVARWVARCEKVAEELSPGRYLHPWNVPRGRKNWIYQIISPDWNERVEDAGWIQCASLPAQFLRGNVGQSLQQGIAWDCVSLTLLLSAKHSILTFRRWIAAGVNIQISTFPITHPVVA